MSRLDWATLYIATVAVILCIIGISKGQPAWTIVPPLIVATWVIAWPSKKKEDK